VSLSMAWRILIVDDETNARSALVELLAQEGYDAFEAADGFAALRQIDELIPDLVLCDLRMPRMDGVELLRRVADRTMRPAFVMMTAHGTVDSAVEAMRLGADHYIQKPLNFDELKAVIERTLEKVKLRAETRELRERLRERDRFQGIVGASPGMREVFKTVTQIAPSRISVLILGGSGTGKELVARAIHQLSPRAAGPFVTINCAALSETLLESELFGHERGSFTGAQGRREGKFKAADGGTLFLDEVAEIPAATQVKLLRFLQEREFERVGSNAPVRVDVRVVAATNRDIKQDVASGRFREDLFYRLNVISVRIPPLNERRADVPLLAEHFVEKYAAENGKPVKGIDDQALARLLGYGWPGNVRELENVIERAVVLCDGDTISERHLPDEVRPMVTGASPLQIPGATLAELERYAIMRTLEATGGSTSRAATMLGISPRTIQYRLKEYRGGELSGHHDHEHEGDLHADESHMPRVASDAPDVAALGQPPKHE
jgi:DNA-binding NtrC family response regulator